MSDLSSSHRCCKSASRGPALVNIRGGLVRSHPFLLRWCLLGFLALTPTRAAAQENPCQVRVVLFVPKDVKTPTRYQQRFDQLLKYTEAFFGRELKRWGHDDLVMPFCFRQGHAEVTLIRGGKPASEYKNASLRKEAIPAARRKLRLGPGRQVWWVFVYMGDPPKKFQGYRGGFTAKDGGWSVCNFDTRPGNIKLSDPLGSPFLAAMTLKGMIHELGHGFQLPHIGPRERDKAGNSLMGPTHFNFRRVKRKSEKHVYLSEAAAAMLSRHPAFRGVRDSRGTLPRIELTEMNYRAARGVMTVSGKITSNLKPVFAVVADESDARPGEYWTKHYVGMVASDGRFSVRLDELARANGVLKTWIVFENGAQTGNGERRGKMGAVAKPYQFQGNRHRFR